MDIGRWDIEGLLGWYVLGFGSAGFGIAPLALVAFLSSQACWNVLLGRRAWVKTSRVSHELAMIASSRSRIDGVEASAMVSAAEAEIEQAIIEQAITGVQQGVRLTHG